MREKRETIHREGEHMEEQKEKNLYPNLKRFSDLTEEEAYAIRVKGQQAMVRARKKKKDIKSIYDTILSLDAPKDYTRDYTEATRKVADDLQRECTERGENVSVYDMLAMSALDRVQLGDVKAMVFVRDSVGDMPTKKEEITYTPTEGDEKLVRLISKRLGIVQIDNDTGDE
jgi:hypothetical protein